MSISKRVKTAFDFIGQNDFENALIYISIVVDATSKKENRKGISQSQRNKNFIDDNQDFIYRFSTGGAVSVECKATVIYPTGTLGRTLYKIIRCGLLHDGVLPQRFVMLDGLGLGAIRTNLDINKPMGFAISANLLIALLILVITSPTNRNEIIESGLNFSIYDISTEVNTIWGDRKHLNVYPI